MRSLLLDYDNWDLVLDINGNIAIASDPYARSQDVACAARTWVGDLWYNQARGVAYKQILGQSPNLQFARSQIEAAALAVQGVVSAQCLFVQLTADRTLRGQIQFIDVDGESRNVSF